MEFERLGSSQVRLPKIGLGTWNYAGGIEPLRAGIAHGACLIDTAESYGTEEIVGQAVRGLRERVFLATKVLPRNFRRHALIAAAERSLRRLATTHIDLYQLHWPNYTVPIEETMSAMEELVEAGKVRFIGVSNFSKGELTRAQSALSKHRIVTNQVRYNLIERTIETGLLQYCQSSGIMVIAYSPLAMGLAHIRANDLARTLAHVAASAGRSEAQVALNWCIAKDNVIVIPKASTVTHAMEACEVSGWRLPAAEYELLERKIRFRQRGRLERFVRCKAKHMLQLFGQQI